MTNIFAALNESKKQQAPAKTGYGPHNEKKGARKGKQNESADVHIESDSLDIFLDESELDMDPVVENSTNESDDLRALLRDTPIDSMDEGMEEDDALEFDDLMDDDFILDDEDDDEVEITIEVAAHNEDTIRLMKGLLLEAKAPSAVKKAFNAKQYEACAKWLQEKKGVKLNLTEGFSKKEMKSLSEGLTRMKAPKVVHEALAHGRYSVVESYIKKTRTKKA
jgi:hypothetical protein